jgi:putative oxidoreductase
MMDATQKAVGAGDASTAHTTSLVHRAYSAVVRQTASLDGIALLSARLLLARTFLLSGLTKWDGMTLRDDTFYLFSDEYFGRYGLPQSITDAMAVAASVGEIVLPALLIVGLFTRLAAAGILAMALVIQIFVYPDAWWTVHAWWTVVAILLMANGPGRISLDRLMRLD